jgi:transposase
MEALKRQGALNSHPARVRDELFLGHDFFDPHDLVQVRYEMLRRVSVENLPPARVARSFGLSRTSFYKVRAAFAAGSLPGLLPRRRGPKQAHKLTGEVLVFLRECLAEDESLGAGKLAARVEERFGLQVHRRSIERALARSQKGGRS